MYSVPARTCMQDYSSEVSRVQGYSVCKKPPPDRRGGEEVRGMPDTSKEKAPASAGERQEREAVVIRYGQTKIYLTKDAITLSVR